MLPELVSFSHLSGELKPDRVGPVAEPDPLYCIRTPWPTVGVTGGSGARQPLASQPMPLILGVFGLTSGATRASTNGDPAVAACLIMTPAFAQAEGLVWYLILATIDPSPLRV